MNEKAAIQVLGRAPTGLAWLSIGVATHLHDQGRDLAGSAEGRSRVCTRRRYGPCVERQFLHRGKGSQTRHVASFANERQNQRVVGITTGRQEDLRVLLDYGNGGEPATQFFWCRARRDRSSASGGFIMEVPFFDLKQPRESLMQVPSGLVFPSTHSTKSRPCSVELPTTDMCCLLGYQLVRGTITGLGLAPHLAPGP